MISFLRGKIISRGNSYIILEVNNIGYKVFVNENLLSSAKIGDTREVFTYQYVREDSLDLYGFNTEAELEFFELLLSISGIGPKSALGVLSIAQVDDLKNTIAAGDPSLLTKVSGIGRKTAERVVLELREKVSNLVSGTVFRGGTSDMAASSDEIDALISLGYSLSQAREALAKVDPSIKNSGERIKQALKNIGS